MKLSLNILLDQLSDLHYESHIPQPCTRTFTTAALLPRSYDIMRDDLIHVCRLSDAMQAASACPGKFFICLRDRIRDGTEPEELFQGMVIVNENMDVQRLFFLVQNVFIQVNSWYQSMQEALIREKSLQDIVDLSSSVIGNTINISDSAFTLLARTHTIETDDEMSVLLEQLGYHPEATLEKLRVNHRLEAYATASDIIINKSRNFSPYILVSKIFRFRNTYFTHVAMVCDHREPTDGLLELFRMLTDVLAVYSERNWKDKSALSHNYDSFFTDLLLGTLTKPDDIRERAKYLGLHTEGALALMKLTVPHGMEAALGRLGRDMSDLLPCSQVVLYQQSVIVLVHLRGQQGDLGASQEQIRQLLSRHQAHGGISSSFFGIENLPTAYSQASLALKYNAEMKGCPLLDGAAEAASLPVLCTFENRVLYGFLGEHAGNESIWRSSACHFALKTLYDYDLLHSTNNLQLLRVYLFNERKATETGQALHMHRNNVIYRIGRIEKMIGMDLNDHDSRLALEMSFILLELYGFESEKASS